MRDFADLLEHQLRQKQVGTETSSMKISYFNLERMMLLPQIIREHGSIDEANGLSIAVYYISPGRITEFYWCGLSMRVVSEFRGLHSVLLEETRKNHLHEVSDEIVNLWYNTWYEVFPGDLITFVTNLERYLYYMKGLEPSLLAECRKPREENAHMVEDGIFYQLW